MIFIKIRLFDKKMIKYKSLILRKQWGTNNLIEQRKINLLHFRKVKTPFVLIQNTNTTLRCNLGLVLG